MSGAEYKSFDNPDEVREFHRSRSDIVQIGGGYVSRMVMQPGWRWSVDVKPHVGTELCQAHHFLYVESGRIRSRMSDGAEFDLGPGEVGVVPPGHDGWVIGDEPVVLVDWGGARDWGRPA